MGSGKLLLVCSARQREGIDMKKRIVQCLLTGTLLCACLILSFQGQEIGKEPEEESDPVYELAALVPVSGDLSYIGEPVQWVLEYVEEKINEEGGIGGIPIEITVIDTEFDTDLVLAAAEELLEDQRIILGPVDAPGTQAIAELITQQGVPNLASYTYESIREETAPYGISYMSDSADGERNALECWCALHPELEQVVILANPDDSAQVEDAELLAEELADLGLELLDIVYLNMEDNGGLEGVVQALNAKADGYISLLRSEEYGLLVTELRKRGVEDGWRITASFSAYDTEMFEGNAQALAGTYIWNQFDVDYEGEEWQELLEAYALDHSGSTPDTVAVAEVYNAVMAWKQCIEELGLAPEAEDLSAERQAIAEWFYNSPVLEGIQGSYQWVNGEKLASFYYFQFAEDGTLELVGQ